MTVPYSKSRPGHIEHFAPAGPLMSLSAVSVAANAKAVSYSIFAPAAPSALFAPGRAHLRFRRSAAHSMRLQACAVGSARARRHGAGDSGGGAPRLPFLARRGPSGRAAVDTLLTRVPYAVLCERLVRPYSKLLYRRICPNRRGRPPRPHHGAAAEQCLCQRTVHKIQR